MTDPTMMTPAYERKPGVMKKSLISEMSATLLVCGAFITMTTEPTMHRKHATLPTILRRSFKKMADRTVVITTDSAPRGVTRMASTKA